MPDEIFRLSELSFQFPEDDAATINGISFSIHKGERVVISGPSGCGKSTLLYLLNRLYPANCDGLIKGEIFLFGKSADAYKPGEINHHIATVFQDPDSQFCMPTVEEELAFTLENLHVPADQMKDRIDAVLELTGLSPIRGSIIQSLSGGMKQRVATACALVMEPDVLLLDEPLAHLDPFTAQQFIHWLDRLQQQFQLTIVAVEHRLDQWKAFFDREIRLDGTGRILADKQFTERPAVLLPNRPSTIQKGSALEVFALSVAVKEKQLLKPLSFTVQRGEIVVVAGPNGSGKSTLLKSLCGILKSPSGTVKNEGGLGYVPQSPEYLFLTQRVKDEVAYSGSLEKTELQNLMARLRLNEIKNAHPFAISHGQKRRVAIAAMLADRRHILLMDEPTSGQDAAALKELFQLIDGRAQEGATFLIVTHDMEFASAIADSVLLLKDGQLTGKFAASSVWHNDSLLAAHHLIAPKGLVQCAKSFA